jgi:hypothetical protein
MPVNTQWMWIVSGIGTCAVFFLIWSCVWFCSNRHATLASLPTTSGAIQGVPLSVCPANTPTGEDITRTPSDLDCDDPSPHDEDGARHPGLDPCGPFVVIVDDPMVDPPYRRADNLRRVGPLEAPYPSPSKYD